MIDQGPCASPAGAVGAFLDAFFSTLICELFGVAALLIVSFGEIFGTLLDVVACALNAVFNLIGDFLDWLFGDGCDEESAEECIGDE